MKLSFLNDILRFLTFNSQYISKSALFYTDFVRALCTLAFITQMCSSLSLFETLSILFILMFNQKYIITILSLLSCSSSSFISNLFFFLIGSFIFLELSCRNCLYIFEINSFSVASFAIIFSHSKACLFTLLIVSFVVQKLLSLIRSHLLIFAFISNTVGGGS